MSKILGYFGQNKWCSLPATWVLIAVTEPLKIPCAGKLLSFKVQEISEGNCSVFNSPKRPKKNPIKIRDIYQNRMTSLFLIQPLFRS